jgi:hypothetical protein
MGNGNRTVWIIVAVVVVLLLLCCCVVIVGGAIIGGLSAIPFSQETGFGRVEERTEQVFTVGASPPVELDNFAGDITVRQGESGQISIIIIKKAVNESRLDEIDIDMTERDDGVRVEASHPRTMASNASVAFEIRVPPDAQLDLDTGAGSVHVVDIQGEIAAHTGAGNVRVQGASAPVALETGAGNIDYEGEPAGDCTFQTGTGSITLSLPEDLNAEVELTSGMGNVDVRGFDVEGQTSRTEVDGVIGSGEEATIEAHTGAGNVTLTRR